MAQQLTYPRGRIATDSGDLIDVTNVKITTTNNAKQIHTLRQKGAGYVLGNEESNISFDSVTSDQGEERDWMGKLKKGSEVQFRLKVPGRTYTFNGVIKELSQEFPLDDAIKYSVSAVGHIDD